MSTLNGERIKKRKKSKRRAFIVITIIEIFLAILVSDIIVQILESLTSAEGLNIDFDCWAAVRNLINNDINKYILLLIEACYLLFLITILNPYEAKIENVDTFFITPEIEKPVPAGNGQYGNARLLREEEKEQLYAKFVWDGNIETANLQKGGMVVGMKREGKKETIYYVKGDIHTLMVTVSGGGKTRRVILPTIGLQLLSGMSVANTDIKGELYYYTSPFAKRMGHYVYAIDFIQPTKSIRYNFLQPILDALVDGNEARAIDCTWDLVSVLVGEQKGEPIWYNGESATIAASILIVAMEAPEEYRNMTNVYYFLAMMCQADMYGDTPFKAYIDTLEDTHPAKGIYLIAASAPDRTRGSFFTSALATLRLFTSPTIAAMTSKSDFRLGDIAKHKSVLYMMVPDEKKTYYPLVSMLITQLYSSIVEEARRNGGVLPNPIDFNFDELTNFPFIPIMGGFVSAIRSRGVRGNISIQELEQMQKKYEEDYKNILTNCRNKMLLESDDLDTLRMFSDLTGSYTVEAGGSSASVSGDKFGTSSNVTVGSSSSLVGLKLLLPEEIGLLKYPYSLSKITGNHTAINELPDLSQYYFNDLFGLGDEEHNRRVIEQRDAEREEIPIPPIKLWGIWKQYQKDNSESNQTENEKPQRISFL